jgi:hypothetical protein
MSLGPHRKSPGRIYKLIGKPRVSPLLYLNTSAVIRELLSEIFNEGGIKITSLTNIRPIIIYFHSSQCRLIPYLHQRPIFFKANCIHSSIVAILELIRGAQCLIEIIIGRIFVSEVILIPPSLKISESSSNGSYRNTDEVWWRYGISRSCDECIQVSFYIRSRGLWPNTWMHVSQSLAIIRNAIHILWPVKATRD